MSARHTTRTSWRGIAIQVDFEACRWSGTFDHVEVRSIDRSPLPITETGYRSAFMPSGEVSADNYVSAVLSWLDEEAKSEQWKVSEQKSRQLTLF
jgi:hypothetical protein